MRGVLEVWGSIARLSVERDKVDETAKNILKKNINNSEDKNNNLLKA